MHLAIFVQPCDDPKDGFLAQIKTGLFDGGRAGTPNLFKYGETKDQAFTLFTANHRVFCEHNNYWNSIFTLQQVSLQ